MRGYPPSGVLCPPTPLHGGGPAAVGGGDVSSALSPAVDRTRAAYPVPVDLDVPEDADRARYRAGLRRVLDEASPAVARRLGLIRDAATARTDGVIIDVFPDQEGDGTFAVWARFDGADSFALDRRLGDERQLFAVVHGERGWEPAVPARPGSWSDAEFEDVLLATVVEWIDALVPADAARLYWEATVPGGTQDHHPLGPSR